MISPYETTSQCRSYDIIRTYNHTRFVHVCRSYLYILAQKTAAGQRCPSRSQGVLLCGYGTCSSFVRGQIPTLDLCLLYLNVSHPRPTIERGRRATKILEKIKNKNRKKEKSSGPVTAVVTL